MSKLTGMMDTPMYRDLYRVVRDNTLKMAGGTAAQFDEAVKLELAHKEMALTPQNYVAAAMDINNEVLHMDVEGAEQAALDLDRDQWEAKMEDKYDFNKEN